MSLKLKGKLCVRSAMVYGSETWAMTAEQSENCIAEGENGD